ncbi:putative rhamnose biosynthetic enzyme 3 [Triticum urartu]|uniref:Putative rhamnose biosynthetic enzyme 3 n=1 Tax=Triticum urartu TaxID=4572 RepID=M7Z7C8_TRIUA|nr:putative rhamnose biosynthetic enzyme 3 [Triticum urartu]
MASFWPSSSSGLCRRVDALVLSVPSRRSCCRARCLRLHFALTERKSPTGIPSNMTYAVARESKSMANTPSIERRMLVAATATTDWYIKPLQMATYEPKNILITGAAGFIASHVANRLVRNYPRYNIVILDRVDYCSSLRNLDPSRGSPNFKFVRGDIASADLVNHLLVTESIDTVMHFAAQTHVDNSFSCSFEFTKNNVYGTHILLEACKQVKIRRFIHVSTDEVYGETDVNAVVGNHEESRLLPTNPYSATKAGAEMLVMAYARSYNLPVITTRGNNVYGPNQFPEKLIPKFALLAMRGLPLPVYGNGSHGRSYLGEVGHVYNIAAAKERGVVDVARDICEILGVDPEKAIKFVEDRPFNDQRGEVGHVYNIAAAKERGVVDVARDICEILGVDPEKAIKFVEDRPFNDQRYFVDGEKMRRLGWSERTTWEEGLRKTVEWYASNADYWGDVGVVLRGQHRNWTYAASSPQADEADEDPTLKSARSKCRAML